jgi:hypothetical protein
MPEPPRIWLDVESSNIAAIGVDDLLVDLYVRFKNGSCYAYEAVPLSVIRLLVEAPSKGAFFAKEIKLAYRTTKLAAVVEDAQEVD